MTNQNGVPTKDEMIETILDYQQEGWYDGDQSDVVDELRGLHNGSEKPLDLWSDSDIINEYERAVEFLEELQDIENGQHRITSRSTSQKVQRRCGK